MATINYTPGQILYLKTESYHYISILRRATPVKRMGETHELYTEIYTYCDLCFNMNSPEYLIVRGDGHFLGWDVLFTEIREATTQEIERLYESLVRDFKEYDKYWYNHFTDSSYFDIQDYLLDKFQIKAIEVGVYDDLICPDFINDIQEYIWDKLCKEMDAPDVDTNKPKMVSLDDVCDILYAMLSTQDINDYEYVTAPAYDNVDDLVKDFRKLMSE